MNILNGNSTTQTSKGTVLPAPTVTGITSPQNAEIKVFGDSTKVKIIENSVGLTKSYHVSFASSWNEKSDYFCILK